MPQPKSDRPPGWERRLQELLDRREPLDDDAVFADPADDTPRRRARRDAYVRMLEGFRDDVPAPLDGEFARRVVAAVRRVPCDASVAVASERLLAERLESAPRRRWSERSFGAILAAAGLAAAVGLALGLGPTRDVEPTVAARTVGPFAEEAPVAAPTADDPPPATALAAAPRPEPPEAGRPAPSTWERLSEFAPRWPESPVRQDELAEGLRPLTDPLHVALDLLRKTLPGATGPAWPGAASPAPGWQAAPQWLPRASAALGIGVG